MVECVDVKALKEEIMKASVWCSLSIIDIIDAMEKYEIVVDKSEE